MTEYGKHGKPRSRLPTLPTLFGNPFGIHIPTASTTRWLSSHTPLNSNHGHRKGLVTDVSGPQRNACPGTLTPRLYPPRKRSCKRILDSETRQP